MTHSLYILDDSPWFEWIRLHSTDSTIDFLKHYRPVSPKDMILVTADFQTAGRGQAGNSWESEAGKNLLFGLLFHPREVEANRQFILSQAVALSICETLSDYAEDIRIKWPNDIYWKDRKNLWHAHREHLGRTMYRELHHRSRHQYKPTNVL